MPSSSKGSTKALLLGTLAILCVGSVCFAQTDTKATQHPWMNPSLSPDQRASMVVKQMTLDEKISLLHGTGMQDLSPMSPLAIHSNGGAGYVVGDSSSRDS